MIRVADDVYTLLEERAIKENRSNANMLDCLLRNGLGVSEVPSQPKTITLEGVVPAGRPAPKKVVVKESDLETWIPEPKSERLANGLCKIHQTPLDNRGKCLQKGCKYA